MSILNRNTKIDAIFDTDHLFYNNILFLINEFVSILLFNII